MFIAVIMSAVSVGAAAKAFEVTAVSSDSVKFSWTVKGNADGYRIEKYHNGKWKCVDEIKNRKLNSYFLSGLKPGTAYYFRLKYYIIKDGSKQYYYSGGIVRCTTALPGVTGFSAASGADSVNLSWNALENCDGYELQRFSGTKWTLLGKISGAEKNSITISNLQKDREYDFRIRGYKKCSSGTIYSNYSYLTFTATDKESVKLFGPNMVYVGESFDYTYCLEGNKDGDIKWSVTGGCGRITDKGRFTAVKKGKAVIKASDSSGKVYAVLEVHCVGSAKEVDFLPMVNGISVANKTYPVPKDYDPKGLTAETARAFESMRRDALKAGIKLRSISGYRSYKTQESSYSFWKESYGEYADSFSAKPGFSEHQLGLAIDVNDMWARFADTKEGKWLEKNCYKYGFILRYPSYASEISTGYEYEPWHIRYVGKELAKKVHFSGSTLEEYLGIDSSYR